MTTELANITPEPMLYTVTRETIENTIGSMLTLKIKDQNDVTAWAEAKQSRAMCVKARTTIEAERKKFKQPHIDAGKAVDELAKELTALLAPVEKHLTDEIVRVETLATIAKNEELDAQFKVRVERLNAIGGAKDTSRVRLFSESEFSQFLMETAETNRIRKEQEAAAQAERERLEAERVAMAAERKALDDARLKLQNEQAAINAQRMRLENEERDQAKAEAKRVADAAAAAKKIVDDAAAAEQKRLNREAEIEKAQEAERQWVAMQPDRDKIDNFAARCREIQPPQLSADATQAQARLAELVAMFANAVTDTAAFL